MPKVMKSLAVCVMVTIGTTGAGVSQAGTAAHCTAAPLNRAGMKPNASAAASSWPSSAVIAHASAVSALIAAVAVRGTRASMAARVVK